MSTTWQALFQALGIDTSVKTVDKNSCPHEACIPVQAHTLNSIVKYVLDRDVCYPKNTGGKANVRGAKEGLPEEKTSEGGKGVSR